MKIDKDIKLLNDIKKYLERKGWDIALVEEKGIMTDLPSKISFFVMFKFIGKKGKELKLSK